MFSKQSTFRSGALIYTGHQVKGDLFGTRYGALVSFGSLIWNTEYSNSKNKGTQVTVCGYHTSHPKGTVSQQMKEPTSPIPLAQYSPRFQSHYENILRYDLAEKLGVTNSHQTPKIEKIILSASVSFKPQQVRGPGSELFSKGSDSRNQRKGDQTKKPQKNSKSARSGMIPSFGQGLEDQTVEVRKALMLLSGQTLSAKTFRVARPQLGIRKGRLAAYQVTLRSQSIYLFLERLLTEVIPKIGIADPALLITGAADRRLQRT